MKRILHTILALMAIAITAHAQTLSVAPIEGETGAQTEMVVSLNGATAQTAVQFRLTVPKGISLTNASEAENYGATLGAAASGHQLTVVKTEQGDLLFVVYNMSNAGLADGELLRLPVTLGSEPLTTSGTLVLARVGNSEAVSSEVANAPFTITVSKQEEPVTITADNLTMVYGDAVPTLTYKTEGAALNGTPKLSTTATSASPVGTYPITVEAGTVTNKKVTYVPGKLTITKAPLAVGVEDVTIEQGTAIPAFTLTYDGFKNNDTEATAFTTKPKATTKATRNSPAGTYEITVRSGSAKNYALSYTNGTLTITAPSGLSDISTTEPFDVYTTAGIKLRTGVTSIADLPTGIYIIRSTNGSMQGKNAQKVIVR